ncbi:hypothetical protein TIFTF001_042191 [Ficus carica]|uniref:Uncharacterized protein n=1 Tax=Ficus carica TaxID=3494 RepID=A0AA88CY98_FICCA|nr:hypothetical protein TIFTF001_042191 [Ficus carica]
MNDRGSAHHHEADNHGAENSQRNVQGMAAMSVFAFRTWRRSKRRDPVPMHNSSLTGQMRVHEILYGHSRIIQGIISMEAGTFRAISNLWFYAVLLAICSLKDEFIRPPDYTAVQPLIQEHGENVDVNANYEVDDVASGTGPSTGPQHYDTRMDAMNRLRDMMTDDMWDRFQSAPWYRTT